MFLCYFQFGMAILFGGIGAALMEFPLSLLVSFMAVGWVWNALACKDTAKRESDDFLKIRESYLEILEGL